MRWRLAKSLTRMKSEVVGRWPGTTVWTVADKNHSTSSDHHPENRHHPGVVTAVDILGHAIARAVAEHLRRERDPRVKYVIFNRRMFSAYAHDDGPAWQWRPYSGKNPHDKHVHVSVSNSQRLYDDDRPWGIADAQEEDVTTEQLQQTLVDAGFDPGPVDNIWGPKTQAALVVALRGSDTKHSHTAEVTLS